jgi:carbonic anhydrase/acetyltransferase-like protein (isoleucine patch superfamily)
MPVFSFEGHTPKIDPTAFIAPTATVVGDVTIEAGASVWYGAVVRADFSPVIIREGANIQDNAVIHGPPGTVTEVGPRATVAHNCVVHGATLGEECLIGNTAIILDGAKVGARSLVAAGSVVTERTEIPDGTLAVGAPAQVKRQIAGTPAEKWVQDNPRHYAELARRHKDGIAPVDS